MTKSGGLTADPFLRAVAHRLRTEPVIGDGVVARACRELQKEFIGWAPQLDDVGRRRAMRYRAGTKHSKAAGVPLGI